MTELRQREPRVRDAAFLAFVREQQCVACGAPSPSEAAHLRMGSMGHGKRETGAHEKPSDRWANPLCRRCHLGPGGQHSRGESIWWGMTGLDPFKLASDLYSRFAGLKGREPGCRQNGERALDARTDGGSGLRPTKRRHVSNAAAAVVTGMKRKLPSRPLKSASRWPARGTRKVRT